MREAPHSIWLRRSREPAFSYENNLTDRILKCEQPLARWSSLGRLGPALGFGCRKEPGLYHREIVDPGNTAPPRH